MELYNGSQYKNRMAQVQRERSPEKDLNLSPPRKSARNTPQAEVVKYGINGELKFQPAHQQLYSASSSTYPTNNGFADYYAADPRMSDYMMPLFNTMNQWGIDSGMADTTSTSMNHYPGIKYETIAPMPMMSKTFPSCTMVPPAPGAPAPSRRKGPSCCKTVFIRGLPGKITEEIIREVFSDCGEIFTVRMSKRPKNFCHVRFTSEQAVDRAMALSGYRIKIENKEDWGYSSRLHVDFAKAHDDQCDYECMIHAANREARHAIDALRPPIVKFMKLEAGVIGENLRREDKFKEAITVVNTWLERGECNKRNAATFYSMIQSIHSHVRRLVGEKSKIEEEISAVKERLHQKSTSNAAYFKDIERVFTYALKPKVWDHFTKPQRKHIEEWKKHTTETKMQNLDDLLEDRVEDEMEMSDDEDQEDAKKSEVREELSRLQEENKLLRGQLRTANEESEKKLAALGETYQLMQRNYIETKKKLEEALKDKSASGNGDSVSLEETRFCTESEARLASLVATFLNVHPKGASVGNICSYLEEMDCIINTGEVENLLKKFSTIFKEESTGAGDDLAKKWIFSCNNYQAYLKIYNGLFAHMLVRR